MRALAFALLLAAAPAHADDEIVRGTVVKVEASEIYVNLGRDREIADGAALRIKRQIRLQHPISRAPIEDWVPVGSAVVTQAGAQLSRAVVGALIDDVKLGDIAEVLIDREDRPRPKAPPPPPPPQGPKVDPTTAEVIATFAAQTGAPLDARIAAWERYLSSHPTSPYAAAIRTDLDTLTAMREQLQPPRPGGGAELAVEIAHAGPPRAAADRAIPLMFVIAQPQRVASAYLHYRVATERTYKRVLLDREHDIYLRGKIPAEAARAPGVQYFLEVSAPTGASGLAVATPAQPRTIDIVERSPVIDRFGPAPGRSSVRMTGEVLDFATFDPRDGDRTDRIYVANVDFTYRVDRAVQSVGVGYGVLAGEGGFADRTFTPEMPPPRSAFQFGYADVEVGGAVDGQVQLSLGGRLIAGVGREGFGMGGEGRLRFGHRDRTNLALVASTLQQVGSLADIRFYARPVSDLKLGVSVGATNQPNNGDIGVKLGSELEYLASPSVSLLIRGSWQGRNTKHGGIGGGAGLVFTW